MTKCQVIQVLLMVYVFCDENNPGQKIQTVLGLNPKLDLEKIHILFFKNPGIDGTTFQDSSAM